MLIDLKPKLDDVDILELLSYSVFPDPAHLDDVRELYRTRPDLKLYGLEDDGELVGLIGYSINEEKWLKIEHLAVYPECRGVGFGRGLILEAIAWENPVVVIAETDEDTVEFYRHIGFQIESLGEVSPGTERFRCTYWVSEADEPGR